MSSSLEHLGGLAVAQPGADPSADLEHVAAGVLQHGASRSRIIEAQAIVVRDDPQAHGPSCVCEPGNLMDPPFAPSPAEFRPWLKGFASALVLQVDRPADGFRQGQDAWACQLKAMREGGHYDALHDAWAGMRDAIMWGERELFRRGYYLSVGFGALTCTLCHTCDVAQLCKFPYQARPSVEAVGVDVDATLARLDLEGDTGTALTGILLAV